MQANAEIIHTKEIKLETSDIMMRYSSLIQADSINISSGTLHMEGEARLDTTARGDTQSVVNPGVDPAGNGLGAGHGGFGGGADLVNYTSGNILGFKVVFYEMHVKELGSLFGIRPVQEKVMHCVLLIFASYWGIF